MKQIDRMCLTDKRIHSYTGYIYDHILCFGNEVKVCHSS